MNKEMNPTEKNLSIKRIMFGLLRYWWVGAFAIGLWAISQLYNQIVENPPVELEVIHDTRIDVTPEEISSIRDIGQWEFLSVSTEEMVEWHKTSTFGDKHLVRIYQGTLRIGIDMDRCKEDWFTSMEDSTALLKLPAADLLDTHFIDEARTRSFYEKGSIPASVYDELYQKAEIAMRRRCLTQLNLKHAEDCAQEHFTRIFKALGFKTVRILFIPTH